MRKIYRSSYKTSYRSASYQLTDVNVHQEEFLHNGFLKLKNYALQYRRFDGNWSQCIERELFVPPYPAVGILLYDPANQKIVLVEQFRIGLLAAQKNPWILELVAGMCDDPAQTRQTTAIREAYEEAGATVKRIVPVTHYFGSPGTSTEEWTMFCGEVDSAQIHSESICGLACENEDIKAWVLDVAEIPALLNDGVIANAATIIALQWLLLNKERLWINE